MKLVWLRAILAATTVGTLSLAVAESLSNDKVGHVLPENVEWQSFPAFPEGVKLAVIVGDPRKPAPFVVRVKVPAEAKILPHKHPEDRIYTIISGIFYIGLGEQFDPDKLHPYPPGSVLVLPGGTAHFHWAKSGEYVSQVSAMGPLGLEYLNPADDPRRR
jgi:quercetin dioxygenase-like cupin family protein